MPFRLRLVHTHHAIIFRQPHQSGCRLHPLYISRRYISHPRQLEVNQVGPKLIIQPSNRCLSFLYIDTYFLWLKYYSYSIEFNIHRIKVATIFTANLQRLYSWISFLSVFFFLRKRSGKKPITRSALYILGSSSKTTVLERMPWWPSSNYNVNIFNNNIK